jgi:serine/threonine-protein kinase
MRPDRDPGAAAPAGQDGPGGDPDATLDGAERALWHAATIAADDGEPSGALGRVDPGDTGSPAARYQIREVLGVGGMGEVRLCRDEAIGRDVAQKTLLAGRAARPAAKRRFLSEARVQGQLEHPSIVPVYDLGAAPDGGLFFTMRRVRGHTLAEVLEAVARGEPELAARYSRRKLLEAFTRVCLAIDYAHARGVLHRDLKPENIMLGDFGEVYVLDWGVARLVEGRATEAPVVVPQPERAGQGSLVGTPGYMSPEQLTDLAAHQDARTDVYALGAILFEILTRRRLHTGDTLEALVRSTLLPAARPSSIAGDVPPELDAACARAAAVDKEERFGSARALCDAVERYLDGDRDVERRRALSAERAGAAAAAFERAAAPDARAEAVSSARADAVREVTAALALDAENAEARGLLVRLFVETPARMPPEVEDEIAAATRQNLEQFLRFGSYAPASWIFMAPIVAVIGVRAWLPVLATTVLSVLALAYAIWLRRTHDPSAGRMLGLSGVVLATVASVTCFMGPFVVVPQIAAVVTLWFALQSRTPRERAAVIAMGALATALPFGLELLRVLPPGYVFAEGGVTLPARAVRLAPETTIPLLFYASVSSTALPAVLLSRVRDALSAAERRLFLQAWHLRKLVPDRRAPPG